jgi:Kef-type K+ transport system membrane component KefB
MSEVKLLFLQMAVILAAARLLQVVCRFIGPPAVIGEMAAGILLGVPLRSLRRQHCGPKG